MSNKSALKLLLYPGDILKVHLKKPRLSRNLYDYSTLRTKVDEFKNIQD